VIDTWSPNDPSCGFEGSERARRQDSAVCGCGDVLAFRDGAGRTHNLENRSEQPRGAAAIIVVPAR
jgi:hypothetical protein